MRSQATVDLLIQAEQLLFNKLHMSQRKIDEESMMLRQLAVERLLDLLDLRLQPPMRQLRDFIDLHDIRLDQSPEHLLAGDPKNVAQHRSQLNIGVFQDL